MKKILFKALLTAFLCGALCMPTAATLAPQSPDDEISETTNSEETETDETERTTARTTAQTTENSVQAEETTAPTDSLDIGVSSDEAVSVVSSSAAPEEPFNGKIVLDLPYGSATVIDNQTQSDPNGITRQFITVQSRGGHVFYIILEDNGEAQNVFFLNAVDDWDLLAFSEEFPEDFLEVIAKERWKNEQEYKRALESIGEEQEEPIDGESSSSPLFKDEIREDVPEQKETDGGGINPVYIVMALILLVAGVVFVLKRFKGNGGGFMPKKKEPHYSNEDEYEDEEDE